MKFTIIPPHKSKDSHYRLLISGMTKKDIMDVINKLNLPEIEEKERWRIRPSREGEMVGMI